MNPEPIKLTPCGLWRWLGVLHGFAVAFWTPNYGHPPEFPTECGPPMAALMMASSTSISSPQTGMPTGAPGQSMLQAGDIRRKNDLAARLTAGRLHAGPGAGEPPPRRRPLVRRGGWLCGGLPAKGRRSPCHPATRAPRPAVFARSLGHFAPSCPALIRVTARGLRPLQPICALRQTLAWGLLSAHGTAAGGHDTAGERSRVERLGRGPQEPAWRPPRFRTIVGAR
jgi:hypothetical protein